MRRASMSAAAPRNIEAIGFSLRGTVLNRALGLLQDQGHFRREQTNCLTGQAVEPLLRAGAAPGKLLRRPTAKAALLTGGKDLTVYRGVRTYRPLAPCTVAEHQRHGIHVTGSVRSRVP